MQGKNVSNIDSKGRVLIPQSMRDALNLNAGEKVLLELDAKTKSVRIEPAYERKLLSISVLLADRPGALAAAANALAGLGVDLVSTQSHSSNRGEAAAWQVECNPGKASVGQIRSALSKAGARLQSCEWD